MAYDSGRGRVVLFGGRSYAPCREGAGRDCAQTWEWDGTSWDARDPVPGPDGLPQARYDHALAYDPGRARTVMVGGRSFAGCEEGPDDFCVHTWEWDGERWTLARPEDPEGDGDPQPRIWPGLVWDEVRQRVVLYGGEQDPAGCGEGAGIDCTFVWEWDGTSWAVRKVADPDGRGLPASYATLAWDAAAGGLLQVDEERTWVMPSVDPARAVPAHALRVRLRAALPSGSAVTLQSVTARWRARGLAWPAGVATPGVELRVWDAGYDVWRPAEPLPGDDPEQIEWTTEDARLLGDLLVGDDLELSLAVLPAAGSTTALPRVETEDAAVTVRYRR